MAVSVIIGSAASNISCVAFGCTGGQHRSVYLAESLAKHLRSQDGIDVILRHRELEKLS